MKPLRLNKIVNINMVRSLVPLCRLYIPNCTSNSIGMPTLHTYLKYPICINLIIKFSSNLLL